MSELKDLKFEVFYSGADEEWVAVCDEFRSLSVLHADPVQALTGLVQIIEEEIKEDGADEV